MTNQGGRVAPLVALLLAAACGSKESATGEPDPVIRMPSAASQVCAPGRTETCPCLNGTHGVQACNAKGTGYDACHCREEPPPAERAPTGEPPATASPACAACSSQEDFDAAARAGSKCCPANLCSADAQCSPRVCCRFPGGGTMCADGPRCSAPNRVQKAPARSRDEVCRDSCPGGELSHCYCVCVGQCPND